MIIDNREVDFDNFRTTRGIKENIKKTKIFSQYIIELQNKFKNFHHNTDDTKNASLIEKNSNEIFRMLEADQQFKDELSISDADQLRIIVIRMLTSGSITFEND